MMLKKKIPYVLLLFSLVLLPSVLVSADTSTTIYRPGDMVTVRYPYSGVTYGLATEPMCVRWTLINPSGHVVYEVDNPVAYKRKIDPFGLLWETYDIHSIVVPGFAQSGVWRIEGRLWGKFWVIKDVAVLPVVYEFNVAEVSFFESLLAPWYFTHDMGFLLGRVSIQFPFHWSIVLLFVIIIILFIIMMLRVGRKKRK